MWETSVLKEFSIWEWGELGSKVNKQLQNKEVRTEVHTENRIRLKRGRLKGR